MDQHKKDKEARFNSMETVLKQMSQTQSALGALVSNRQSQSSNRLPAQPFTNPKDNVSAITLRSGKQLGEPHKFKKKDESKKEVSEKTKTKEQDKGEEKKGQEPKSRKHQEMTLEDFKNSRTMF